MYSSDTGGGAPLWPYPPLRSGTCVNISRYPSSSCSSDGGQPVVGAPFFPCLRTKTHSPPRRLPMSSCVTQRRCLTSYFNTALADSCHRQRSKRLVIGVRWVSKALAFAGKAATTATQQPAVWTHRAGLRHEAVGPDPSRSHPHHRWVHYRELTRNLQHGRQAGRHAGRQAGRQAPRSEPHHRASGEVRLQGGSELACQQTKRNAPDIGPRQLSPSHSPAPDASDVRTENPRCFF
jgi:hypothetical protein